MLGRELRRQLITARITELLILLTIDLGGLFKDLLRDLLVVARSLTTRVRMDLRAVDRDHPDLHETLLRAEREHLTEEAGQC